MILVWRALVWYISCGLPCWNTYYWARDDFVNTDGVSHVYSTWSDVNKHNINKDCAVYNDQDKMFHLLLFVHYICYFMHTLPHTFLTVILSLGLFGFTTLFIHSFLHSLTHSSKFILSFILTFKCGYALLLAEIAARYIRQFAMFSITKKCEIIYCTRN